MATTHTGTEDLGKLILRISLGVMIVLHGIAKVTGGVDWLVGMIEKAGVPGALGYLVYVGELLAPLLLIVGVWTRLAAVVIAGNMVVAVVLVHMAQIFSLNKQGGWALELQGIFLFAAIAIALLGAGRFSVGGARGRFN